MEEPSHPDSDKRTIELQLTEPDFEILEKYRGALTADAFVAALLRMLDSGAVVNTPVWAKEKNEG